MLIAFFIRGLGGSVPVGALVVVQPVTGILLIESGLLSLLQHLAGHFVFSLPVSDVQGFKLIVKRGSCLGLFACLFACLGAARLGFFAQGFHRGFTLRTAFSVLAFDGCFPRLHVFFQRRQCLHGAALACG